MTTWTQINKSASTWANTDKVAANWSNLSANLSVFQFLMTEAEDYLVTQAEDYLITDQSASWSNLAKS